MAELGQSITENLPKDLATAARERGRTADLWMTDEALLEELEASPDA